jgi:LmbE family N-acetylglucosaminyl deacetylase
MLNIDKLKKLFFIVGGLLLCLSSGLQNKLLAQQMNSTEIQLALEKTNTVGAALYIAAHPDDENTALLSYLETELNLRTAYLSLTRGDGGQNLIGSEQAELMGIIRTQELLAARRIDGAEQFFTRANDFGFSKSPEEALKMWGKDAVLSDVVWVIRKFRPDVIITRFPTTGEGGHGHHTASALLAEEAFYAAADPKRFPEQLNWVQPWQAKRVLWNTWSPEGKNNVISVDLGKYNALLGKSYSEIAAESRSMHKSQGFGAPKRRGERLDYMVHKVGIPASKDLLEGINTSWSRVKGGEAVAAVLSKAYISFNPEAPHKTVPLLLEGLKALDKVEDVYWREQKAREIKQLLVACAGIWYEAVAENFSTTAGAVLNVTANAVKRSPVSIKLNKIELWSSDSLVNTALKENEMFTATTAVQVPANASLTHPYWLLNRHQPGLYEVNNRLIIGKPENQVEAEVTFSFDINGTALTYSVPIKYKRTDPVDGEIYRQLEVVPDIMLTLNEGVYLFPDDKPKSVFVTLRAGRDNVEGKVSLALPKGWKTSPDAHSFALAKKDEQRRVEFKVYPSKGLGTAELKAEAVLSNGKKFSRGYRKIQYPHIPVQILFPESVAKVVRLDVTAQGKIGYIMGAGDEVPAGLRQIGYNVFVLSEASLDTAKLEQYDAIVAGIRAYNTIDRIKFYQQKLMNYVYNGGTYILQYNVSRGLVTDEIGPYSLKLSRDRITEEDASLKILQPEHPVFNYPNKITTADFDNWVQERGLYFADQWDDNYIPLLAGNDRGEDEKKGMLLYAPYGSGTFIYTGLSFFRQLPAGVPGAYRLFSNMIATDNNKVNIPENGKDKRKSAQ